jgi:glycine cleavage system aminomethyltransferase T
LNENIDDQRFYTIRGNSIGNIPIKVSRTGFTGEYGFEVYWDGHGSAANVSRFAPLGVSGFVLGTAALFGKNRGYKEILSELRGRCG